MPRLISRVLLPAVVLLVVLLVGADRGLAYLADRAVASQVESAAQLTRSADVTVHGFPFLTQAVAGRYDSVEVTMRGLPAGDGLVIDQLDTTLRGVHAPLGQAISGSLQTLAVDSGDAVGRVSFAALAAAAKAAAGTDGVDLTITRVSADRVLLKGQVDLLVDSFTVSGQAQLGVVRGQIVVKLLPNTITGVPAELRDQAVQLLNLSAIAVKLPFGFVVRSMTIDDAGVQVRASGTSLTIG